MTDKDEYRRLWSGQIAADPYLQWLGRADEKVQASEPFRLTIVDVLLSGDAEHYELASPSGDVLKNKFYLSDELQLWLRATKQQLSTFKSEIQTRIIIFSDDSDITVRNLLGTKYNIEPEFFADIQHERWMRKGHDWGSMMGTGKLRWQGAYQAFKYANGKAIRHLKFENGFIACLSHDVASDPKANKNVGTSTHHPPRSVMANWPNLYDLSSDSR